DVVVAHVVRLLAVVLVALALRLAPRHRDAGPRALPLVLLRQLLHRVLELLQLLQRLLLTGLPAARLAPGQPLLRLPHPVLRLLQHLLVLRSEDRHLFPDLAELLANLAELVLEPLLRLSLLPHPLHLLLRSALAFARERVLQRLDDVAQRRDRV